ncbi:MAG: hypothetical protein EDM75_11830 [Chlorobiota bacterium]|nr:MAG: hypothetical protein EDM75_11830 [Chlorobiota bacterium]
MSSNTLTLDFQDVLHDSTTPLRYAFRGIKIFVNDSPQFASSTKVKQYGWNETVQLDISSDLDNSFSEENLHFVSDLNFNLNLLSIISDSDLFSEEMDPEISRVLAKHNLQGKKKRTRW